MVDKKGRTWTAEELLAELRYLASAVEYGWDEDLESALNQFSECFDLLPEE